jgi:carboxypeptidase Q
MNFRTSLSISLILLFGLHSLLAQETRRASSPAAEIVDTATVSRIIDEGMNRSQVMETLSWLTDVCGPRLTGSPGYKKAAKWAKEKIESWGLQNAHLEGWGPFGRGWSVTRYSAHMTSPQSAPLLSFPKAWSPGTGGTVKGKVVNLDAKTDSALDLFRGTLKGKFVLIGDPVQVKPHFEPLATRQNDSTLLQLANADARPPRRGDRRRPERTWDPMVEYRKLEMCLKEGAAAILTPSRGDEGTIFVQAATVPEHPDTPFTRRRRVYDRESPAMSPQVAVAAEHYNRIVRILAKGENVELEMNLSVATTLEDSVYNVIAEIPGSDLKDEIVMIGAHLDSWHGGSGATDNGTGVATCMEAVRLLKKLELKPRRTIRIGLWGAEEQGLLGSRAYVKQHLGERAAQQGESERGSGDPPPLLSDRPDAERFSAYFNNDNGTGKVRGVYMQGNEALRPIFRAWLAPFRAMGASTLSLSNTGGTDHTSFDAIGLPGFQFIQDDIEYFTRTWHSTMDLYDRAIEDDLKEASVIMATFAYNAAMRDEKIPRKPRP